MSESGETRHTLSISPCQRNTPLEPTSRLSAVMSGRELTPDEVRHKQAVRAYTHSPTVEKTLIREKPTPTGRHCKLEVQRTRKGGTVSSPIKFTLPKAQADSPDFVACTIRAIEKGHKRVPYRLISDRVKETLPPREKAKLPPRPLEKHFDDAKKQGK